MDLAIRLLSDVIFHSVRLDVNRNNPGCTIVLIFSEPCGFSLLFRCILRELLPWKVKKKVRAFISIELLTQVVT